MPLSDFCFLGITFKFSYLLTLLFKQFKQPDMTKLFMYIYVKLYK